MNPQSRASGSLARALALRDLTDPATGGHAVQHVVAAIEDAATREWPVPLWHDPGPRIVPVADNYDRLRYDPDAVTRDARYTRYVGPGAMLRSHTTAHIPALLDHLDETADVDTGTLYCKEKGVTRKAVIRRCGSLCTDSPAKKNNPEQQRKDQ